LTRAASTALACLLACAPAAAKGLGKGDARKLIAALSIFDLNSGAVTIREINSTESEATALANVMSAFRFARGGGGRWRAAEVRAGDRQWEDLDLLAAAAGAERIAAVRAALDELAAELEARAQERKRGGKGEGEDGAIVRGALRVENPAAALSALGSSAVVEAEVEASFSFVRERGRWRVSGVRLGGETLGDFDTLALALDRAKTERARADLDALNSALEAYRRERGSYVVAGTVSALDNQLGPRHLPRIVHFDPWHRPYAYEGTRGGYVLRSAGPDGKPNTADDVMVRK
jgi:hypothetical protein